MRIYRDRLYILAETPGISGFKRWGETERRLVTGEQARNRRSDVEDEYTPDPRDMFRLEDGHLPEHQRRVGPDEAMRFVREHCSSAVLLTDRWCLACRETQAEPDSNYCDPCYRAIYHGAPTAKAARHD